MVETMPQPEENRSGAVRAWLAAGLWLAMAYASIPFVGAVRARVIDRWGEPLVGGLILAILVAAAAAGVIQARRVARRLTASTALWLLTVSAVYVGWAWQLRNRPEEAIHLVEYGVLGILLERALRHHIRDATVYLVAALVGGLLGTVDEIIQWLVPGRYWDFRDIVINGGSSALALAAWWRVRPRAPEPVLGSSWRPVIRLVAAYVLLLTLCLANTPPRVRWYAERIPGLAYLKWPTNQMAEYGHRHVFPNLGEFRSRFTLAELEHLDATRWADAAAILDRYPPERYGRFLHDYPSGRDPFVHEARVHLFSRDRHLAERLRHPRGSAASRRHASVALRENDIVATFFGRTLRASSFQLTAATVEELRRHLLADYVHASRAGTHLITWISEDQLRTALLMLVVVLIAVDRVIGRAAANDRRQP